MLFSSYNTTLRSINLEWNPIGEEGAAIMLNALRSGNTSLTELNLGSCGVSLATQRCFFYLCLGFGIRYSLLRASLFSLQSFASQDFRK
jgi:hypothetical protein